MSNKFWPYLLMATIMVSACKKDGSYRAVTEPIENKAPVVNAGADLYVHYQANTCILQGQATDPNNDSLTLLWRKLSGPTSYLLHEPTKAVTKLSNLELGNYSFELAAADPYGSTGRDTVTIHVYQPTATNAPTIDAGLNIYAALPTTSVLLTGTATARENLTSVEWVKVSGPASYRLEHPDSLLTRLEDLEVGDYEFELIAKDAWGTVYVDRVNVYVYDPDQKEYVFAGAEWECPFGCMASFTLPASIPVGAELRVSIRSSTASQWKEVRPESYWSAGAEYVYGISDKSFWVYADEARGKVDVRIKW